MFEYETYQARSQELHRVAAHERLVREALLSRREARRRAADPGHAARERTRPDAGGVEGSVRPAI